MITNVTCTLPNVAPNLQAALEKVQDDVDFYTMLNGIGQQVTDSSGNPVYWSENRIHNLSAENCLGIKFAEGYKPAGRNLVFSGTLAPEQIAAVNAGKTIDFASSGGDYVMHLDPNTGGVTCTATPAVASTPQPGVKAPVRPMDPVHPATTAPDQTAAVDSSRIEIQSKHDEPAVTASAANDPAIALPPMNIPRIYPDQILREFGAGPRHHSVHRA